MKDRAEEDHHGKGRVFPRSGKEYKYAEGNKMERSM